MSLHFKLKYGQISRLKVEVHSKLLISRSKFPIQDVKDIEITGVKIKIGNMFKVQ